MSNPHEEVPGTDSNPDPITGEPGSHPLGTGIGAASGAATGAAIGAIGGPVGSLVGGAIGAVTGGYVGKGIEEHYDPTVEDAYWKENHGSQSYAQTTGRPYEDYQSAYTTGHQGASEYGARGSKFEDVESDLKTNYEQTKNSAAVGWEHAKDATRAAYDRVTQRTGSAMSGSTTDRVEGNVDQASGTVRENVGSFTGDREMQAKGTLQNLEGKAEEGLGNIKKEFGK